MSGHAVGSFLRRYGLNVACAAVVVVALIAAVTHVARLTVGALSAKASATLTIGNADSEAGWQLIAALGGDGTGCFALVTLSCTSKGNACGLDIVVRPDGGWTLAAVSGDGNRIVSPHDWANIVADNRDAALVAAKDMPFALTRSAGTITVLFALADRATTRAGAARIWLVDRCSNAKPLRVRMPHTLVDVTEPLEYDTKRPGP